MNLPLLNLWRSAIIKCSTWGNSYSTYSWWNSSSINHEQENPRDQPSHIVKIKKSSNLYKITKSEEMFVNSAHHQSVDDLGKGLEVNSFTEDGVIEGIENPNQKFCIGVQWHPEFLIDEKDLEIFKALVESSRKNWKVKK